MTLDELSDRVAEWRKTRRRGTRMPDDLWSGATDLARQDGAARISKALGVDYSQLKRLVAQSERQGREEEPQLFLEIPVVPPGSGPFCSVEFERADGGRMKLRDLELAAVLPLCRVFWETAG